MLRPVVAPLRLPIQYNRLVQGLVYHLLQRDVGGQVHGEGFAAGARRMRLFAFSRLLGPYALEQATESIIFPQGARLVVTSPVEEVVRSLAGALLDRERLQLGEAAVGVESVYFEQPRVQGERAAFRTLGPVTVYSTVNRPDGTRFTYYFEPASGEFQRLALQNLAHKYMALHGTPYAGSGIQLRWRLPARQVVVRFSGGVVKGYTGSLEATGDPVLLQLALDAGLGAKNAQGFGLLELVGGAGSPLGVEGSGATPERPAAPPGPEGTG